MRDFQEHDNRRWRGGLASSVKVVKHSTYHLQVRLLWDIGAPDSEPFRCFQVEESDGGVPAPPSLRVHLPEGGHQEGA